MHHRITYICINFQQNRVSRSVKTMRTNIFAKKCKLHIFAIPNTIFVKSIISDMHHRIMYMYIKFQQNRVNRSVKTVLTKYSCQKNACCINLQLPNYFLLNRLFQTCIFV